MTRRDEALAEARAARNRFEGSLDVARRNLTPAKLGQRAALKARRGAKATIEQRPVVTAAVGALLAALIFRKPIAGLVRHLRKEPRDD